MQFASHKFIVALSLFVLLAFVPQILNAQKGEFGVRFMPTISSLDVQSSSGGQISGDATVGFGAGIFLGFNFSDNFGLQGEAIYSTLNQKYTEDDVEKEIKLEYINIPLLLSFNTGKLKPVNFNVVAGPQIGISVGSELFTSDGGDPDNEAVLSVKKGDLGFAYGAGFDFGLNAARTFRLGLGFRGVYGLIDISDNSNNNSTNSYYVLDKAHIKTYSAYLGVSFLF
ncbi:MAG: PorT family protein [Saprospiraceae bacterium]|nr:PorT family protein [Candidatus Opimibacter skivensis]MBP6680713.1 PorT family protein [Saprospiraceae bacterium]